MDSLQFSKQDSFKTHDDKIIVILEEMREQVEGFRAQLFAYIHQSNYKKQQQLAKAQHVSMFSLFLVVGAIAMVSRSAPVTTEEVDLLSHVFHTTSNHTQSHQQSTNNPPINSFVQHSWLLSYMRRFVVIVEGITRVSLLSILDLPARRIRIFDPGGFTSQRQ